MQTVPRFIWLTSPLFHPTVPSRFYNSRRCYFYYQFSSICVITRQRGMVSFSLGAMEQRKGQRSGVWKIQQNSRSNDGTCHSACIPKVLLEYRAYYFFFPFPFQSFVSSLHILFCFLPLPSLFSKDMRKIRAWENVNEEEIWPGMRKTLVTASCHRN